MEDFLIIDLYFSRNENAIKETSNKYGALCFSIANNILSNIEDTEECVNDTYLTLWNSIPPQRPNNFIAFIYKITRNLSLKRLDYNLAKKRNPGLIISFEELDNIITDNMLCSNIEDEKIGEYISRFLRTESPDSRNVFMRRYYFFDSISMISKKYNYSEGKVKSMPHRTRKRLKEYLNKEGVLL